MLIWIVLLGFVAFCSCSFTRASRLLTRRAFDAQNSDQLDNSGLRPPGRETISCEHDRREDISRLTLSTFNTFWLFHPEANEPIPLACPWKSSDEAERHIHDIAKVLDEVNADIFVLTEVQNMLVLEYLRSAMLLGN